MKGSMWSEPHRSGPMTMRKAQNILSGLEGVDLASFIAGSAPTTILSDFGAMVIKIKLPGVCDPSISLSLRDSIQSCSIGNRSLSISNSLRLEVLYWNERGDPTRGNSVSGSSSDGSPAREIVLHELMEGTGIALDIPDNRMFVTDPGGSNYVAALDGSGKCQIAFEQVDLSGIAHAEL
jgi:hypothetical protein